MTKDLLMHRLIVFRALGFVLLSSFFLFLSLFSTSTNAQLQFNITDGQVAPTPIAIANFTDENGEISEIGKQIAQVISSDLESSGLFKPLDTAAFIAPPAAPTVRPNFTNWTPLGVKGLLVGSAQFGEGGKTLVEFVLWDVVTGEPIASAEGEADRNGIRRIAHQIADFVYEEFTGDIGYFDTRVVYVAESGSQSRRLKRLAIMDQDGHNHQYLTSGADLVLTPRFSPTANEIAYLNYFNDEPNVYLFEIATGRTERLGSFPGMTFAPRFAPSGDKLIMSLAQNGMTDIYEMDMRTQAINRLTHSASIDTSPSYSPDGKQIVFNSDRGGSQQLYVMDADGDKVRRISFNQGRYATPVWSPRGDIIAFTKMANGQFYIGVMKVDGTGERLLAKGFLVEGPTWAPNGRVLMYFKQQPFEADGGGGDTHVYRIDITGFNEKRIITPSDASDPAWSPALR